MANVIKIRYRSSGTGVPSQGTLATGELGYSEADNVLYIGDTNTDAVAVNGGGTWGSITGTITNQTDLVDYIAQQVTGLDAKGSVKAATTTNITLSGTQTIDGVALVASDRVLVKNQTTTSQNGIYVVAAGAWARAADMDDWLEVPSAFTFVEEGTTLADTGWVCTANAGGTLNSTAIEFVQFSAAGSFTADGDGIELVGTEFQLELDGATLSKSATGLKVNEISNTEIAAAAAIAWSKMANLTNAAFLYTGETNGDVTAVSNAGAYSIIRRNAANNGFEATTEIYGGTFS